jgi:hypothetical protein
VYCSSYRFAQILTILFAPGPKIFDDSKQEDDDPKYESNVLIC